MIYGVDLGSTTTKIVLMDGMKVVDRRRITREESFESAMREMGLEYVEKIMLVGTGASYVEGDVLGIPTVKVDEFQAVALGGYFLSGLDECMVVSLGTGTSFTYVNRDKREHAGGCGIGGALLHAYARWGLGMEDVTEFLKLAEEGSLDKSDLLIKDISKTDVGKLYGDVTVANMAKINKESAPCDFAFGACNLVFQNVGVMAVMADRPYGTGKIVIMGSVGQSPVALRCFKAVGDLFKYEFLVPDDALYGVAIGAVLYGDEKFVNALSYYGIDEDCDNYLFE